METSKKQIAAMFRQAGSSVENAHLIVSNGHWKLVKEGNDRATAIFQSKEEAIERAKIYVRSGNAKAIIIHKPDGSVERRLQF